MLALGVASRCSRVDASRHARAQRPNPDRSWTSGDHRRRDFRFQQSAVAQCGRHTVTRSERTTDHMMQRTLTRIDSPRFTGARRSAASWRAPVGANGVGSYAIAIGLDRSKRHMCGQWCMRRVEQAMGREQQSFRTSMSGDRPLDAVKSGAGSRRSEGTP
jgi:hypothetical protein